MGVGKRIKERRKELKLSLRDLAAKIDISISFLSDIENGRSQPSLGRLKDIARGLDTSVSYLLEEEDCFEEDLSFLLKDFASWPEEDQDELLAYLKAKRTARQTKQ